MLKLMDKKYSQFYALQIVFIWIYEHCKIRKKWLGNEKKNTSLICDTRNTSKVMHFGKVYLAPPPPYPPRLFHKGLVVTFMTTKNAKSNHLMNNRSDLDNTIQKYNTKFIYIVGNTNSITLAMNSYLPT